MIDKYGISYYNKALNIPAGKSGDVEVIHTTVKAGKSLPTASLRTVVMGGHTGKPVQYGEDTVFHKLEEEKYGTWMTDLPIEQKQADDLLYGKIHGKVLIGGLGLGYATTLVAHHQDVTQVTVVEKSPDVIKLVWEHLDLPTHIECTVIEDCLMNYLDNLNLDKSETYFDSAFYDIWQSDGETVFHDTVVPLRMASFGLVEGPIYCWNEDVMRGQLTTGLQCRLLMLTTPDFVVNQPVPWETFLTPLPEDDPGADWINWSVPFFMAVKEGRIKGTNEEIESYCKMYGKPEEKGLIRKLLRA